MRIVLGAKHPPPRGDVSSMTGARPAACVWGSQKHHHAMNSMAQFLLITVTVLTRLDQESARSSHVVEQGKG